MHVIAPYGMHYTQVSMYEMHSIHYRKAIFWNLLNFEPNMAHLMCLCGQCFGVSEKGSKGIYKGPLADFPNSDSVEGKTTEPSLQLSVIWNIEEIYG